MSTSVDEGCDDVAAGEIEQWVRFVYQADDEHRDPPRSGVPPLVIAEAVSDHRHRETVRRHLEADQRVVTTLGIGPRGPRVTFIPAEATCETLVDTGDGVATDGGDPSVDRPHPSDYTRFQLDQLAVIARLEATETTCYGLAVKEALAAYYGDSIHHPRNYQNLDALAEAGLIEKSDHDGRTNQYELTGRGRELLSERTQWLADTLGFRFVDVDQSDDDPNAGAVACPDGGQSWVGRTTRRHVRDEIVDRVLSPRRLNPSAQLALEGDERRAGLETEASADDDDDHDADQALYPDGGTPESTVSDPATDRAEAERRARQAARTLEYWSRRARLDLLTLVAEETAVPFESRSPDGDTAAHHVDRGDGPQSDGGIPSACPRCGYKLTADILEANDHRCPYCRVDPVEYDGGDELRADGGTTAVSSESALLRTADIGITDEHPARERALALVWFVLTNDWDRVEDVCLSLLSTARQRRAGR